MNSDPIADFLTRVRNAISAKNKSVDIPVSKEKIAIAEVMKNNGFISECKIVSDTGPLRIFRVMLKYTSGSSAIVNLQRVSRPG